MIVEKGVVEEIVEESAVVRIQQTSSCSTCQESAACKIESDKEILIEVRNDLHAKPGDQVEISVPSRSLMKTGTLIYLFPVLTLIAGAFAGNTYASRFDIDPNLASLAGGALAMGISFGILKRVERSVRNKPEYHPRMTRILISVVPFARVDDSR